MQHTVKGCREPSHNKHVRPREHMRIKWTAVHFAVEANVATVSRKRSRQINGTHWLRQLVRAGARLTAAVIEIAIHNQNALPKALGTCARAGTKWNVIGHGLFQILGRLCGDRELCRRSGCKEEPAIFASEDSTAGLVSPLCGTACIATQFSICGRSKCKLDVRQLCRTKRASLPNDALAAFREGDNQKKD